MQKLFNIMIVPILSYGGHFGHFFGWRRQEVEKSNRLYLIQGIPLKNYDLKCAEMPMEWTTMSQTI